MVYFTNEKGSIILNNLIIIIQNNKEYLSEIDGAIGDGDHGINMNKGFTICKERLDSKEQNLSEALYTLGDVLFNEIGGSMGPIYGFFFMGMSESIQNTININKNVFGNMVNAGLEEMRSIITTSLGDKTLLDCLIPAILAYQESINNDQTFAESLNRMKIASEKGKDSTKDMIAKVGRASRLGERSRGALDAGAVSCNLIINSICTSIAQLIE